MRESVCTRETAGVSKEPPDLAYVLINKASLSLIWPVRCRETFCEFIMQTHWWIFDVFA